MTNDVTGIGSIANSPLAHDIYKDLLQPASKEIGKIAGLITQQTRLWVESVFQNARESVPEADRTDSLPPRIGIPIYRELLLIGGENELSNLFSELLKSANNKNKQHSISPIYANILSNLSPHDAKIFSDLATGKLSVSQSISTQVGFGADQYHGYDTHLEGLRYHFKDVGTSLNEPNIRESVIVLLHAGLATWETSIKFSSITPEQKSENAWRKITINDTGRNLALLCNISL